MTIKQQIKRGAHPSYTSLKIADAVKNLAQVPVYRVVREDEVFGWGVIERAVTREVS